jgi:hypothetical protein
MGFESFTVTLTPCQDSPIRVQQDAESMAALAEEIRCHWPSLRPDDRERDEIAQYPQPGDVFLFSETDSGLYQMLLQVCKDESVHISLRFALCNPRTVYDPFCQITAWLMHRYKLRCHDLIYVPPSENGIDFCDPKKVAETLIPSMDENQRLWQLDAGTEEEAALRPGDAFVQIYFPRLTTK